MNRLQSSTSSRKYHHPPCMARVIGPQRSPWTSSNAPPARYLATLGKGSLLYLPDRQLSHNSPTCLMCCSPRTICSNLPSASKLNCSNRACHSHGSSFCHAAK